MTSATVPQVEKGEINGVGKAMNPMLDEKVLAVAPHEPLVCPPSSVTHGAFVVSHATYAPSSQYKRPAVVVEKILEDFREVSTEALGTVKNLGHGDRNVSGVHVRPIPSANGPADEASPPLW